jgi:Lipopolysaccharide kinase (Kdo/WaaP) family
MSGRPPEGYVRLTVRGVELVAEAARAAELSAVLEHQTLYAYARDHASRLAMQGRLPTYSVPLASSKAARIVVRHSHHGGLFAALTGDRFLAPTRAPLELRTSLRLRDAGVRTPTFVGYAVYPAGPLLRRADVVTYAIPRSLDLAAALQESNASFRVSALGATAVLLQALTAAGARHPDLNLKNVLLADGGRAGDLPIAYVLDVDRVRFGAQDSPGIARANFDRLTASARKWRDRHDLRVSDGELEEVARGAGVPA